MMEVDQVDALTDQEARDLFDKLVSEVCGTKAAFARHYGLIYRTPIQWNQRRPQTWAIVALQDRKEAMRKEELYLAAEAFARALLSIPLSAPASESEPRP